MGNWGARGFTLIELMVALAVMAIVLSLAIPSFESIINANRLSSAANEMVASIQTARMESLRRNRRAIVCLSATPNASSPTCSTVNPSGWITFLDADGSGNYNAGDTLLRVSQVKAPVLLRSSPAAAGKFIFRSDGLARDNTGGTLSTSTLLNARFDVCIATRRPAENVRHVNIGFGSSVSVEPEDKDAACATPANYTP